MQLPPSLSRILPGDSYRDPSVITLLAVNIITIIFAVIEGWDLASVLFIYWAQSVVIGIFTVVALLSADTAAIAASLGRSQAEQGGEPVVGRGYALLYKCVLAGFFALHYGLFHWGYYSFIVISGLFGPVNFDNMGIWASCGLFFANHLYSHLHYRGSEEKGAQFITEEFFRPYNRIIPMHLTILFGSVVVLALQLLGITTLMPVLVLFLALKTWMDIRMHLKKHYEQENPGDPVQFIGF